MRVMIRKGLQGQTARILQLADEVCKEGWFPILEPLPGIKEQEVYRLQIRKENPESPSQYKWDLMKEGTLDEIEEFLNAQISERNGRH